MKTGLALIGVAVALALAWLAREVLLLAFFGVVLSVVFSFPVGWLSRIVCNSICSGTTIAGCARILRPSLSTAPLICSMHTGVTWTPTRLR